jgi:O-antigen/teichoic acid export membrane protein
VFNNTDTIILTVFCGLMVVSVYSMYAMLLGMISTVLGIVVNSLVFAMGQSFHVDRKKFLQLYDAYELCYMTLAFALFSVANFFILPFIRCYTAGITDISYVDQYLPLLMITTYLLSCGRSASSQVINIAGHFKKTQYRSLFESFINITVSLVTVQIWGIYGVLIGTIVALLYRANDMILYANHKILNCSAWNTYKRWIVNAAIFIAILFINPLITVELSSFGAIILFCIPYTLCTLVIFFGVAFLTNGKTTKFLLELAKPFFCRKG